MKRLRTIAAALLAVAGMTALGTAAQAQAATTGSTLVPLELQVLDHTFTPLSTASVSLNGVTSPANAVGRYTYAVSGPKVAIRIDLLDKGLAPVILEIPLEEGSFVYMEVCLDPTTGAVKDVFQKATKSNAAGRDKHVTHLGVGQATTSTQNAAGPPANDDCANAVPLADGVTPFSTLGSSTDGPDHPGDCEFGNGETVNDIWYVYTASCTGAVTVSTCDDADFDTDIVMYDGVDCLDLLGTLLGCDDDTSPCGGFTTALTVPVVAGNDYLVRVGGYGAFGDDSMGSGNLTVSCEASMGPGNDDCADAIDVGCNSITTVDTTFYTTDAADPAFSCFFGGAAQGFGTAWFTFVADETSAFINTNLSAGGDSQIAIYDGTCGAFTELACSEDEGLGLLSEFVIGGLTVGNTYYVQLGSFSAATQGEYILEVVCPAPGDPTGRCCLPDGSCFEDVTEDDCFTSLGGNDWLEGATCLSDPCPMPLPNDDCDNAIALGAIPTSVIVDNTGATTDGPGNCGVASGPWNNVWYTFEGVGAQTRVTTCRPGTLNGDTKVSVFCSDCVDLTCVGGNDDAAGGCVLASGFSSTFDFCSQVGTTYYVTVGDFSATSGSGPIELLVATNNVPCTATVGCDPVGACCMPTRCISASLAECEANGGEFQGEGTTCIVNGVGDPGFELGAFGGVWSEGSSTFGTPICDLGSCGTGGGVGPFAGDFWCWFGGISGVVEVGFVEQSVVISSATTMMTFYLDIPASSGNGSDFMTVSVDGNVLFTVLEGDPTYTLGYAQVSVDLTGFNDDSSHDVRFDSTTFGDGLSATNFFIDDVVIGSGSPCETCVEIDFETEDDGLTALVNGQDIDSEFGTLFTISSSTISEGPAIFDTDPTGPNLATNNDPDLLVDLGNALIFQEVPGQTVPGIYDDPDDSSAGGTFFFDFLQPVEMQSVVIADIDVYPLPQDAYITLVDSSFNTRTYHLPSGFTEDLTIDGGTGWRQVDLTTLADQAGFSSIGTASEDAGFDATDVVRMEVSLTSSGAIDDVCFCF